MKIIVAKLKVGDRFVFRERVYTAIEFRGPIPTYPRGYLVADKEEGWDRHISRWKVFLHEDEEVEVDELYYLAGLVKECSHEGVHF